MRTLAVMLVTPVMISGQPITTTLADEILSLSPTAYYAFEQPGSNLVDSISGINGTGFETTRVGVALATDSSGSPLAGYALAMDPRSTRPAYAVLGAPGDLHSNTGFSVIAYVCLPASLLDGQITTKHNVLFIGERVTKRKRREVEVSVDGLGAIRMSIILSVLRGRKVQAHSMITSSGQAQAEVPFHIAATVDPAAQMTLYVNGVAVQMLRLSPGGHASKFKQSCACGSITSAR